VPFTALNPLIDLDVSARFDIALKTGAIPESDPLDLVDPREWDGQLQFAERAGRA
jgi:hypothetical protein